MGRPRLNVAVVPADKGHFGVMLWDTSIFLNGTHILSTDPEIASINEMISEYSTNYSYKSDYHTVSAGNNSQSFSDQFQHLVDQNFDWPNLLYIFNGTAINNLQNILKMANQFLTLISTTARHKPINAVNLIVMLTICPRGKSQDWASGAQLLTSTESILQSFDPATSGFWHVSYSYIHNIYINQFRNNSPQKLFPVVWNDKHKNI